jgi:hypothetical protein
VGNDAGLVSAVRLYQALSVRILGERLELAEGRDLPICQTPVANAGFRNRGGYAKLSKGAWLGRGSAVRPSTVFPKSCLRQVGSRPVHLRPTPSSWAGADGNFKNSGEVTLVRETTGQGDLGQREIRSGEQRHRLIDTARKQPLVR